MVMCTNIFLKLSPTHVLRARKYNKNNTQDKSLLFINLLPQLELKLNTYIYIEESLMVKHY